MTTIIRPEDNQNNKQNEIIDKYKFELKNRKEKKGKI